MLILVHRGIFFCDTSLSSSVTGPKIFFNINKPFFLSVLKTQMSQNVIVFKFFCLLFLLVHKLVFSKQAPNCGKSLF